MMKFLMMEGINEGMMECWNDGMLERLTIRQFAHRVSCEQIATKKRHQVGAKFRHQIGGNLNRPNLNQRGAIV